MRYMRDLVNDAREDQVGPMRCAHVSYRYPYLQLYLHVYCV